MRKLKRLSKRPLVLERMTKSSSLYLKFKRKTMDYVELVVLTMAAVMLKITLEWKITRNRSGKRRSQILREGIFQIKISNLRITRMLHPN